MPSDRCEPPEALRGIDGLHYLGVGRNLLFFWEAQRQGWREVNFGGFYTPERVVDNWPFPGKRRYVAPVYPPKQVAELVRAARAAAALLEALAPRQESIVRAALTPFADIPDAE